MKKKPKILKITLSSLSEIWKDVHERDKKLSQGFDIPPTYPELSFADLPTFLSYFTSKRIELIAALRLAGHLSIRQLARVTSRDFKNIHTDIQLLKKLDIVKEDKNKKIYVPWDVIDLDIHIDLAQMANKAA